MRSKRASVLLNGSAVVALTAALTVPQVASAQQDEIVVTGSRVARSTFTSPTPITVIDAQQIQKQGQINIAETVKSIPQNVAAVSDTNVGTGGLTAAYNVGAQIANLRGLNPTNGVRTLTLVDTKRFVPSTTGGAVDMNLIPSLLVARVETVTGGASAAYGTDALAGVVNVLLDTDLQGLKAQVDYGQTFRDDGGVFHAALAGGSEFADGRGHIIFGVEYEDAGKVGDCTYVREWCSESPSTFINEGNATNGEPRYVRGFGAGYTNYDLSLVLRVTTGGNAPSARRNPPIIRGLKFTEDGTAVVDYEAGKYVQAIGFNDRQGGENVPECSVWSEVQLRPAIERMALFTHAEYDLTDSLRGIFEASYGYRESATNGLSLGPSSATPIRPDNAFLEGVTYFDRATGTTQLLTDIIPASYPDSATAVTQAPGVPEPALFIAKHMRHVPGARNFNTTDLETYRFMAGLEGDFFVDGWNWDAYYQYGRTTQHVEVGGVRVNSFFTYAIDAVRHPTTGEIVCRATLPGAPNTVNINGGFPLWNDPNAEGCKPLNLLGMNTEDPAAVAYAYRTQKEDFEYEQHVLAANLTGTIFEGWAGPIGAAAGAEYRFETGETTHVKLPFNGEFTQVAFGNDFGGDLEILEGYVEVNVPILRDAPFARAAEVNGAYRRTEQTNTDAVTGNSKDLGVDTWKVSGTWDVNDWLRFRGTKSQDIRAAGFVDLYYNQGTIPPGPPAGTALNPWALNPTTGLPNNDAAEIQYPPNFTLEPEKGDTTTYGVVLQPGGFLDGLRMSADYYNIEIEDAIVVLTTQQSVDACFTASVGCEFIFDDATGTPFSQLPAAQRTNFGVIARGARNIGAFEQKGWDFEVSYTTPLDRFHEDIAGDLTFRTIATYVSDMIVDLGNGSAPTQYAGQTGASAFGGFTAPADYTINNWLTYDNGGFSITVDTRYIPEGIYDIRRIGPDSPAYDTTNNNSINYNTVESRFYVGLATSYRFLDDGDSSVEVFATVRNLFDSRPPAAPTEAGGSGGRPQGVGHPTNPVFFDVLGAQWRAGVRLTY